MNQVPLLDLKAQFAQIRSLVMPAIEEVCASQRFILGEQVSVLETEMARYCASSFGIGVSSGTDALLLALMALGVGDTDEVITSPFTFLRPPAPSLEPEPARYFATSILSPSICHRLPCRISSSVIAASRLEGSPIALRAA